MLVTILTCLRFVGCAALTVAAFAAHAGITYLVTDLGTLGGTSSVGYAINASGQVAGQSSQSACGSNCTHAFRYGGGTLADLQAAGGYSIGTAINGSGMVVGAATVGQGYLTSTHAVSFSGALMTDLGTLGGTSSFAQGVNDLGWVVGDSGGRGFLYRNGSMLDIGTLGGAGASAIGINNSGQITGSSITADQKAHAFIWANGIMTDIGAPTDSMSYGSAINAHGDVAGYIVEPDGDHVAFIYSGGAMTGLGTLGGAFSNGYALNASGFVVGTSTTAIGLLHAFLFDGVSMVDLNDVLDSASGAGWTITDAVGINDAGQIVANGYKDGVGERALLLTAFPTAIGIPEPATSMLIVVAVLAGAITHRTRHSLCRVR